MSTILAVDDSILSLQMVKNTLNKQYKVIAVTDGQSALRYLDRNTCDLIILDYEMPGMNGMAVLTSIREKPENAEIPVIFLTGSNDSATVKQILSLKPDGYIVKPVVPAELLKRVEKTLAK